MSLRRLAVCLMSTASCLGAALFWQAEAAAGLYLWDAAGTPGGPYDGSGTWDTSGPNWTADGSSTMPWANNGTEDDTAYFGFDGAGPGATITVGTVAANQLHFQSTPDPNYRYTLGTAPNQGTITLAGGAAPTITVERDATIKSTLAGTSGLTVTGYNTLTLGGNNTYSGPTTVAGIPDSDPVTLLVDGSHDAGPSGGDYHVTGGGRIGGSGTIATTGDFTVDSGSQITGGGFGTFGTLTIDGAGARKLSGTYQVDVDYAGTSRQADLLVFTGAASLDLAGSEFAVNVLDENAIPAEGANYAIKIFETDVADPAYAGPGQHDYQGATGLASYQSIVTWDGGKTFYLVPEPASLALLGLGGLLLLRRPSRRRGR